MTCNVWFQSRETEVPFWFKQYFIHYDMLQNSKYNLREKDLVKSLWYHFTAVSQEILKIDQPLHKQQIYVLQISMGSRDNFSYVCMNTHVV